MFVGYLCGWQRQKICPTIQGPTNAGKQDRHERAAHAKLSSCETRIVGLFFCSFWIAQVWICVFPSFFESLLLSSFLGCFLELWQRRTAPYGTHRQGKYGAHWCLQPRLPRSQILDWNQWFTQTTSHVFKLRFANYQIDILESKSRRVIAFLPHLILYHLCLVCPVRVLGQKTATGWQ